jgi:hypothetical protein
MAGRSRSALTGLVMLLACLGAPPALGADAAAVAPADALVYVELGAEATEQLVSMAALPPAAGLFLGGRVQTPFGHLSGVLNLPEASLDRAAPHVETVGLAVNEQGPVFLIRFDAAQWAEALLKGAERFEGSPVAMLGGPVAAVSRDEVLVLGTEDACRRIATGDYAALAAEPPFAEARAAAADSPAWAYLAARRLMDLMHAEMPMDEASAFDAFARITGLERARYAAVTVTALGVGSETHALVRFDGEDVPLLALLPQTPPEVAAAVPQDAAATLVLNWEDGGRFFGGILDIALQMDAAVGDARMQQEMVDAETELGLRFEELFAQLGSGAAVYLPPPADKALMGPGDWTAVLLLDDPAGFRASLERIVLNAVGQPPMPHTHEGVEMSRLFMPPAFFTVTEDRMVLGGSPEAVKGYLDWQADPAGADMAVAAGAEPLALLLRADLGYLLASYPTAESSTKMLLSLRRVGPEIRMAAAYEDLDIQTLYRAYVTSYFSVMAAMLMPALGRARGEARKAMGQANLHNIGLGLAMYEHDNEGQYPETLEDLYTLGYLDDPTIFVDPADEAPVERGDLGLKYSYEFVGPIHWDAPAGTIVCCTRKGVHGEGRNVLCRDSAVLWLEEWQLQADTGDPRTSLRASYDAMVAAYGNELTPERDAALKEFYEIEP